MTTSLVSVVMITYCHDKYIEEAISGVLMQECNFFVNLIIVNDCSPDNTDEVVKRILRNHPRRDWITYIKHEKNIGMMPNFIFALNEAKSKYIALCEGDDYWSDTLKLKKQIDFLEKNSDFMMVAHRVDELYDGKILSKDWRWDKNKVNYTLKDYLYQLFFHTSSVVYRNVCLPNYINNKDIIHGDIALFTYILSKGKMHYFNDIMSVYRKHNGGISNSTLHKNHRNNRISKEQIYFNLNVLTERKFNKFIMCNLAIENQIYLMYATPHHKFHRCIYRLLKIYFRILLILQRK